MYRRARKILVLTGSPSDDFIAPLLAQKHDADIWGEGAKVDTVEFLKKMEIDQAPAKISKVLSAIHALSDIELHTNGLKPVDRRRSARPYFRQAF